MANNIKEFVPAINIHPGEILKDELNERRITQKEFASLTGIPQTQLNEIIKGKRAINADVALVIGNALKMDAVLWMNLQSNYELDLAKINEKNKIRLTAINQWDMIKEYVSEKFYKKQAMLTGNPVMDIPIIKEIYGVDNFEQLAGVYAQSAYVRFRKSDKLSIDKINLVGWAKLINYKASKIKVQNFDVRKQNELILKLKSHFRKNINTVEMVERTLAEYGIKLVVLPNPEKCAVEGISFWSKGNPAIGISLRYKRIDSFAFTIMHELGHIFLHLINDNTTQFIDLEKNDLLEYSKSKEEIEANEFSKKQLIPEEYWGSFIQENNVFDEVIFSSFAKRMNIHPAIVLGRFCFEKDNFRIRTSIDKTLY